MVKDTEIKAAVHRAADEYVANMETRANMACPEWLRTALWQAYVDGAWSMYLAAYGPSETPDEELN